jgi:hypothetical protein
MRTVRVGDLTLLRLTLLAPDIVEAILDGRQPVDPGGVTAAGAVSDGVGGATRGVQQTPNNGFLVASRAPMGQHTRTEG